MKQDFDASLCHVVERFARSSFFCPAARVLLIPRALHPNFCFTQVMV